MMVNEALFQKFGKTYKPGEIVFCEYEPGNEFYLIYSGHARVTKIVGDKEKTLDIFGPGDIFGEMAILEQQPRSATIIAQDELKVLVFTKENFITLLNSNPELALKLLKVFCKRIYDAKRQLMVLTLEGDEYRVADVFVLMAEKQNIDVTQKHEDIEIKLTTEEIASMSAIPVERCERVLRQFARAGKIEVMEDKVIVHNIREFHRMVESKRKIQKQWQT